MKAEVCKPEAQKIPIQDPTKSMFERMGSEMVDKIVERCKKTMKPDFWVAGFLDISTDYICGQHDASEELRLARERHEEKAKNIELATKRDVDEKSRRMAVRYQRDEHLRAKRSFEAMNKMEGNERYKQLCREVMFNLWWRDEPLKPELLEERLAYIRGCVQKGEAPFYMFDTQPLSEQQGEDLCRRYTEVYEARRRKPLTPATGNVRQPVGRASGNRRAAYDPPQSTKFVSYRRAVDLFCGEAANPNGATLTPGAQRMNPPTPATRPREAQNVPPARSYPSASQPVMQKEPIQDSREQRAARRERRHDNDGEPREKKKRKDTTDDGEPREKKRKICTTNYPMTTRIRMAPNPKSHRSRAWERYQLYEKATTIQEFYDLGGGGDFKHDLMKGFITILDNLEE